MGEYPFEDRDAQGFDPAVSGQDEQAKQAGQVGQTENLNAAPQNPAPAESTASVEDPAPDTVSSDPTTPLARPYTSSSYTGYGDTGSSTAYQSYGSTYRDAYGNGQSYGSAPSDNTGSYSSYNPTIPYSVPVSAGSTGADVTGANSNKPVKTKKSGGGAKAFFLGLLGGLIGTAVLAAVLFYTGAFASIMGTGSSGNSGSGTAQSITIDPTSDDITVSEAVAAKVLPSVVSVYSTYSDSMGMGSGVVYDTTGNIITNYHVVEDATAISVTISGKSYEASLVGYDSSSDIAVVKAELNGDTVTPIEVGDSSALAVGEWVMTVGSPFGFENSVSSGIVSALYRETLLQGTSGNTLYTNLIQTDASINPGNSGGALVNAEGQLVGICTLYSSSTESSANVGFAIPGNYAVEVAQTLISGEIMLHAYIGLTMSTVDSSVASNYGLSVNYGAYVVEVTEGSPADEAGIQVGDVIIGIGGSEIASSDGAVLAIRSHSIGETVEVVVMRGADELSFSVTLGSDEVLQQTTTDNGSDSGDISIDDILDNLTPEDIMELLNQFFDNIQDQNQGYPQQRR